MIRTAAVLLAVAGTVHADDGPTMQLGWWDRAEEANVGHYWIKADLSPGRANALARQLNLMYEQYARVLASLPARTPEQLNVLVFAGRQDYLDTLRTKYGVFALGTDAMFFRSPGGNALALCAEDLPALRLVHVMQHQAFHQFAYSRFGEDLPVWLNEGLAEFFGESVVAGSTVVIGQANPRVIGPVKDAIEKGTYIPFQRMLAMTAKQWSDGARDGRVALQAHQAWTMVRFLLDADFNRDGKADYADSLATYLDLLNRAFPADEAFTRAFGADVQAAFEQRWKEYALALKSGAFVTAMERIEFLAAGALELSRQKVVPKSLEELRDALRAIRFTYSIDGHEVHEELTSADGAMFEIPMDELTPRQPVFEVSAQPPHRMSVREKQFEDQFPTPPSIGTMDLKPGNLSIRWNRDATTGAMSIDIIVK